MPKVECRPSSVTRSSTPVWRRHWNPSHNQILYGRRGTGKTHAFSYLAATRAEEGDISIYIDLRTVGSAEGLFEAERIPPVERTARLLIDLLTAIHDAILDAALDDNDLIEDSAFVNSLDSLLASLGAALTQTTQVPQWLGVAGIVIGPLLMVCALEFVGRLEGNGWRAAALLTPIAYIAWSLWLIAIGIALIVQ